MQALSHFTYHYTNGEYVVCDLQGGCYPNEYVLTDPVVLSGGRHDGPTDLGRKGIENFFLRNQSGKSVWAYGPRPQGHRKLLLAQKPVDAAWGPQFRESPARRQKPNDATCGDAGLPAQNVNHLDSTN